MFVLLITAPIVLGLAYLICYGGFAGPIDWVMNTATHGSRDHRRVALTFDDGPDPVHTPALLEALRELDAPATFFVLGQRVDAHAELAARIVREGHELGNHTYNHRYLPLLRSRDVAAELAATDAAIERATGIIPVLARPPYGGRSPRNVHVFDRHAKRLVLWDVNSLDWTNKTACEIVERVLSRVRPGSIVLFHEARVGGEVTVEAVRMLVPALRERGYELSTVTDMLATRRPS